MSCQQVPRVTEDPYLFTETVPTTPTLFNPQIHKLTSFISNPTTLTESKKQKLQQTRLLQHQPQQNQQQPLPNLQWSKNNHNVPLTKNSQILNCSRINGISTTISTGSTNQTGNGIHRNVIGISSLTQNAKNVHSNNNSSIGIEAKLISNQPTRKILTSQQQSSQIISWNQTSSQITPPLYTISNITTSTLPNATTITSSPLLPPSNFHKNTLGQHMQSFTSVTPHPTTAPIPAYVIHQQSKPKPKSKPKLREQQKPKTLKKKQQLIDTHIQMTEKKLPLHFKPQQNQKENAPLDSHSADSNGIPINFIFRKTQLTTVSQTGVPAHSPLAQPLTCKSVEEDKVKKSQNGIDTTNKNVKLPATKVLPNYDGQKCNILLNTDKSEQCASTFSIKKTLKTQSSGKTKETYKESSHHEALQRISKVVKSINSKKPSLMSSTNRTWHAPDSYNFDYTSPFKIVNNINTNNTMCDSFQTSCLQSRWLQNEDYLNIIPLSSTFSRDQKIELRKIQLRRQAIRLQTAQQFYCPFSARNRIAFISNVLHKLDSMDEECDEPVKQCIAAHCTNSAIVLTAHCYVHITQNNDQHLFLPCTAKFSNNSQCRIPVFDITHKAPLCQEHAWKCDNYDRMVHEQKPKNANRKRFKEHTNNNSQKRLKKKKKLTVESSTVKTLTADSNSSLYSNDQNITEPIILSENSVSSALHYDVSNDCNSLGNISYGNDCNSLGYDTKSSDLNNHHSFSQFTTMSPMINSTAISTSLNKSFTTDMLSICENSYESSEDTGVGGLSETELIGGAHDVIEEIPMDHEFTNVLNTIPVDALHELFNAVQQEEQEEVERALALADKQVKSLQQMQFLSDFLDVDDHILDDTDICSDELLNSPETSGIDANTLFVDGGSNSIESCTGNTPTPSDLRGLVQT